ncbi:hypothetical protein ACFW04_013774 [Cataglyphis niger]
MHPPRQNFLEQELQISSRTIFGGIERDSRNLFIVPVSDKLTYSPIPLISRYIKPRSIIHTDCWKAYSKLNNLHYQYKCAHTQNIEHLWREMKAAIPGYGHISL